MTLEQVKEKYGNVKLKFSDYYKYSFNFTGTAPDGEHVYASIGGGTCDLYRCEVRADEEETIATLSPNYLAIVKDGETIFEQDLL